LATGCPAGVAAAAAAGAGVVEVFAGGGVLAHATRRLQRRRERGALFMVLL
jgi:hypothetical protein